MHIRDDDIHAGRHDAERAARKNGSLVIEAARQNPDTITDLPQNVLGRDLAILEKHPIGVRAAHAELVELGAEAQTGEPLLDDEDSDALRSRVRIRLGVNDERVGVSTIRDPHLRAVDDVAVAFPVGSQLHADDVGAGVRLAHREGTDVLAGYELGQILRLLLRAGIAVQLIDAQVRMSGEGQADGCRGPRNLLHGDHMCEIPQLSAAVFLADRQSENTDVSELVPEIVRKKILRIDRGSARGDLIHRKPADGIAQHLDILAEREIQRRYMSRRKPPDLDC